jgi:hypothetical protein
MDLARRASRRPAAHRLAVAALLVAAAGCTAAEPGAPGDQAATPAVSAAPAPPSAAEAPAGYLHGRPLAGPTGLRLLVAGNPPRLLDVDRGTSRRVGGLPAGEDGFGVAPLGDGAVVTGDREVFVLPRGAGRATPVGNGINAVASLDGRGVWLLEHGRRCTLREVGLEGRARRSPMRVPCGTGLLADTPSGLLVWIDEADGDQRLALLDPGTGHPVGRYAPVARHAEVHGVAGDLVLSAGPARHAGPFTLTDRRTGARHKLARPTPRGQAGLGQLSPDGRLLAVEFADVSWDRVKGQVSDIWLLDLPTRRWRRLPGMPLITAVKFMSMEWTGDGRLVLVGDFDRFGEAMAVWRPGQDQLAIKRLDLPEYGGSDTFVVWSAAGA